MGSGELDSTEFLLTCATRVAHSGELMKFEFASFQTDIPHRREEALTRAL